MFLNINRLLKNETFKFKLIISSLILISFFAIAFAVLVLQIQAGASAYLSGLTSWSRGQTQTLKNLTTFLDNGDEAALQQAKQWYQIPLGDLEARPHLEKETFDYEMAKKGLIKGRNHPDDIGKMIWLFRLFQNAPYFDDAIDAWRATDGPLLDLGLLISEIEQVKEIQRLSVQQKARYLKALDSVNKRLITQEERFRQSMTDASRVLVTILSFSIATILILLMSIAFLLIHKLIMKIKQSEKRFRTTFEKSALGIAQLNASGEVVDTNEAFDKMFNITSKSAINTSIYDMLNKEERIILSQNLYNLAKSKTNNFTIHLHCKTQEKPLLCKITGSVFTEFNQENIKYILLFEDETERQKLTDQLHYHANFDTLTGLVNRRYFEEKLNTFLIESREKGFTHSLCFIDLDQFKVINDTVGHLAGDQLLVQVSNILSEHLRKRDVLSRIGGDEFAIILDCCGPDSAASIAESILQMLNSSPFVWEQKVYHLGCSMGIAAISSETRDITEVLQLADSACYLAKEKGRNQVVISHQEDKEICDRKIQMEWIERINRAIKGNKLFLEGQRINYTTSIQKWRFECLVRMREGDNTIFPGAFIPAAERFGLAPLIDRWVIEKACSLLSHYLQETAQLEACHINISGRSFDRKDFTEYVLNTIKKHNLSGKMICFEITETSAVSNLQHVNKFIEALRTLGCTFALDDFGAGLSSFSYLKQLDVDILKIDGAFIRHISTSKEDRAMVKAICDIGHSLGKTVIAEFVEDKWAEEWLSKLGVELVQGFYIHKPEAVENLFQLSKKQIKSFNRSA